MQSLVPQNATRRLAKDQPEYHQLSVADVVIINNPEVRNAQARELLLEGEAPAMQTIWQPDPNELQVLLQGGYIVLTILGRAHPPVHMGVMARERPEGFQYVTVTQGVGGWYAVLVVQGKEGPEPVQTGTGRYDTAAEAEEEANIMSQLLGVPYRKGA